MDTASISITTELISTPNDIKMAIYKNSDPTAIVQFITETGIHAPRTWNFAALERVMHFYKLYELDGSGNVINTIIGPIYFLPSNTSLDVKNPVLIKAGTTIIPGTSSTVWPTNVNTVTVPDWIGWHIESFERIGLGSLKYDEATAVDMSYNILTGAVQLLNIGDVWQPDEYYLISFVPKIIQSSGGTITTGGSFTEIYEITSDTLLTLADLGKKILINPSGNYLEITLPALSTVPENKITWFEFDVSFDNTNGFVQKCAAIKTNSGDVITWLEGGLSQLEINPSESFELYKRTISTGVFEWRIQNDSGSWQTLGELIYDDMIAHNVLNKVEFNGANLNYQQYAKFYNRYILKLPSGYAIPYASWNGSDITTYTKFSLKDPSTGNFRVPKCAKMFLRATDGTQVPGIFVPASILPHQHEQSIGVLPSPPFGKNNISRTQGNYNGTGNVVSDMTSLPWQFNSATGLFVPMTTGDGSPMHRITRIYARV